ncbi:hypothetical protein A3K81_01560 [Candidatus Bathyarchaeota archaeon RBG_13_60_20]|nr:MAG: hypothetical protein A3K81_01560 [Candidatus Bathyarchaeota archaeon RBG_13_60_20]
MEAHIVKALKLIGAEGPGRKHLAARLELGEGVVRTLLGRLMAAGLVSTSRSGTALTEMGRRFLSEVEAALPGRPLGRTDLTVARSNYLVLVRSGASRVRFGVEQRDEALLSGARGATTLLLRMGGLLVPGLEADVSPGLRDEIMALGPGEGDAVIIGSADSGLAAEIGAYSSAIALLTSG